MSWHSVWPLLLLLGACNGRFDFDTGDGGISDVDATSATKPWCRSDTDCPPGLYCESSSGECVGCIDDAHCKEDRPRCDYAIHRCVECGSSSDCASNRICEKTTHRCVVSCATGGPSVCAEIGSDGDNDGDDSIECEEGRAICVRCDRERPCRPGGPGPVCDSAIGLCVECVTDRDCPSAVPRCDRTRGKCLGCLFADDCPRAAPWCDGDTGNCLSVR